MSQLNVLPFIIYYLLPRFHHAYDTTHLVLNKYQSFNVKYNHLDGYLYYLFIYIPF